VLFLVLGGRAVHDVERLSHPLAVLIGRGLHILRELSWISGSAR
jgi:hypothetical protein